MGPERAEPPMLELIVRNRSTEGGLRTRPAALAPSLLLRRALNEDGSVLLRFFPMGDSNDDIISTSETVQGCGPLLMTLECWHFNIGAVAQPRQIDRATFRHRGCQSPCTSSPGFNLGSSRRKAGSELLRACGSSVQSARPHERLQAFHQARATTEIQKQKTATVVSHDNP